MNKNTYLIIRILSIFVFIVINGIQLLAQEELKVEDVKVIKEFEARLKDFKKVKLEPVLPAFDISSRSYEYLISSKPLKLQYKKPSIRPLALASRRTLERKEAVLMLGYGLPNALLGEFSIGKQKESFISTLSAKHLSANNKKIDNQKFLTNSIGITLADAFVNDISYKGHAFVNLDYYNLYGIIANADTTIQFDSPQRRLMHWDTGLELAKKELTETIDGSIGLNYRFLHNNIENIYENNISGLAKLNFNLSESFDIQIPLQAVLSSSNARKKKSLYLLKPNVSYKSAYFSLRLGADLGYSSDYYIYPSGRLSLHKIFSYFDIFLGVDNDLYINSTYQKAMENPFLHFASDSVMTSVFNAYYAGFRGDIEGAKFEITASYALFENLNLFVPSTIDERQFSVIYDSGSDIKFKAQINYEITKQVSLSGQITKHIYSLDSLTKPWHRPDFEADFTSRIALLDNKLNIEGSVYFASGLYYPDSVTGDETQLPVIFDISGLVQYEVGRDFKLFIKWNNIASKKYNRWYQYPSYRIHLIGGIKVLF